MPKYVYDFSEGNRDLKDLLGGKGANLAEMTNLGLPVPPGFIDHHRGLQRLPRRPATSRRTSPREVSEHLEALEKAMGKQLGQADDPLLVSVRSGAKFSMPGMMDTVLNIGLNDESVDGLAKQAGSERFAWDSYRRLIQMFGKTVLGVDGEHFDDVFDEAKKAKGITNDLDLDDDRPAADRRQVQGASSRSTPAGRSPPTRASSSTSRSARSSTRGTATAPSSTAARSGSPPTSVRRSTSSPWSSATSAWTPAPASPSPATRAAARRACTATTCRTRRARTSSPASATRWRWPTSRTSTSRRTTS